MGKNWERECAKDLREAGYTEARRNLEDRVGKGYDLEGTHPLVVQCKYGSRPSINRALDEAAEACEDGEMPVAAVRYRRNFRTDPIVQQRGRRLAVMRWEDFLRLQEENRSS